MIYMYKFGVRKLSNDIKIELINKRISLKLFNERLISEFFALLALFLAFISIILLLIALNFLSILIVVALALFVAILLVLTLLVIILFALSIFFIVLFTHADGSFVTVWRNILAFLGIIESFDVALCNET
jgi:hypothetical protein